MVKNGCSLLPKECTICNIFKPKISSHLSTQEWKEKEKEKKEKEKKQTCEEMFWVVEKKAKVATLFKIGEGLDQDSYKQPGKAEVQILWEVIPEHLRIKRVIFICQHDFIKNNKWLNNLSASYSGLPLNKAVECQIFWLPSVLIVSQFHYHQLGDTESGQVNNNWLENWLDCWNQRVYTSGTSPSGSQ